MYGFLAPKGIEPTTWETLFSTTVASFSGESAAHRGQLFNDAKMICDLFVHRGCRVTVLIDGSFVTDKLFPKDVDVWIFASDLVEDGASFELEVAHLHEMRRIARKQFCVDLIVHPTQNGSIIDNSVRDANDWVSVEWYISMLEIWFAGGRDNEPPKGAFLIKND